MPRSSRDITHEIGRLQDELLKALADEKGQWPRRTVQYVHGEKEALWDAGEALGLNKEACRKFSHALSEVTLVLTVEKDGTACIVEVNGRAL
jgi:hypothetical protein